MNKSQELVILRYAIHKLGPDSYCGPWLASVADEVEQQVRGDFFPTPSIAATQIRCDVLVEEANQLAKQIEADARAKGIKIVKTAKERAATIINLSRTSLQAAIQRLEHPL